MFFYFLLLFLCATNERNSIKTKTLKSILGVIAFFRGEKKRIYIGYTFLKDQHPLHYTAWHNKHVGVWVTQILFLTCAKLYKNGVCCSSLWYSAL